MGKLTKVFVCYERGSLTDQMATLLGEADEGDLRVLSALLLLADKQSGIASVTDLPTALKLSPSEVDASIKFWRGAGVISAVSGKQTEKSAPAQAVKSPEAIPEKQTAHRGGVLERSGALTGYSSAELADLMEQRRVSAGFIDEAQQAIEPLKLSDMDSYNKISDRITKESLAIRLTLISLHDNTFETDVSTAMKISFKADADRLGFSKYGETTTLSAQIYKTWNLE